MVTFLLCLVAASGAISGSASASVHAIRPERQAGLCSGSWAADQHSVAIAPVADAPALASVNQAPRARAAQKGPSAIGASGQRMSQIFAVAAVLGIVAHIQRVATVRGYQATGPPGGYVSVITLKQNVAPAA